MIREKGVVLAPEAVDRLDALPATFNEFRSALMYLMEPQGARRKARKPDLGIQTPERSVASPRAHAGRAKLEMPT